MSGGGVYRVEVYQFGTMVKVCDQLDKRVAKAVFYKNNYADRYPKVFLDGEAMTLRHAEKHFGKAPSLELPKPRHKPEPRLRHRQA